MVIPQANTSTGDYLQAYSDTLHDYLNIYLQKKEKKTVTILRMNKNMEVVATIENVDIARLNSVSGFESELFYFKNYAYTIRTVEDTSGRQFYLNKYILKSDLKNFEYSLCWQFPFERKNINSAHIIYADYKQVLMYVVVNGGVKQGQWIVSINAATGNLIKGTKLGEKGDGAVYEYGHFIMDTLNKTLTLAGQKFLENQWKEGDKQPSVNNAATAFVYLIQLDSAGEVIERNNFKVPVVDIKSGARKTSSAYLLRIARLTKDKIEDKFYLETDIFKSSDNLQSFLYSNTTILSVIQGDEGRVLQKNTLTSNPLIEKFYMVPDRLDINGKLFNDSLGRFEKLFYRSITFPVKQNFKISADGSPLWLLKKSYPKRNILNFTLLRPGIKTYELNTVEEFQKSTEPNFIPVSDSFFLIGNQFSEANYRVKLIAW